MTPKVVFFCGDRSPYGLAHLTPLVESGVDLRAVVVATDERWARFRQALRGKVYISAPAPNPLRRLRDSVRRLAGPKARSTDVPTFGASEPLLRQRGIPVWREDDVNTEGFVRRLKEAGVDVIVSAAYPQIFSAALLEAAPVGAVNFHPSLLPKYRGAHPHFWTIANGAETSGVTAHFMTDRIDDGDIIAQRAFPVADYTYSQLYQRIVEETPALVREAVTFLQDPNAVARPQDEAQATSFRNPREVHMRVFWSIHTAEEIRNLVRTETAFCTFRGEKIGLRDAYVSESNRNLTNDVRVEPGTIVDFYKDSVVIQAKDACVHIGRFQVGRRILPFDEWVRARGVFVGERLG